MSEKPERIDVETTKLAGTFLFKTPNDNKEEGEEKALDMRSRIKSDSMFKVILYYGVLSDAFGVKEARDIVSRIKRCLISQGDINGRTEAVSILQQNFPKRVEVEKGYEEY